MKDTARWLIKLYEGEAFNLIEGAEGSCLRLAELLRPFKAFNDPVAKKSYLLTKLLERSRIFHLKDPENLHVPIDNHLTRLSLRLGLVKLEEDLEAIVKGRVSLGFDVRLRMLVRNIYRMVSQKAEVKPSILDDILWTTGRTICLRAGALCVKERVRHVALRSLTSAEWLLCPFEKVCEGLRNPEMRRLKEPKVFTWWY